AVHAWPNVYFATRYALVVHRSTDGGQTWVPSLISRHDPADGAQKAVEYPDKEWMAVDNSGGPNDGHVYLVWIHIDSRFTAPADREKRLTLRLVRSTDGGVTWSAPVSLGSKVMPYLTVGAGGEVYLATADATRWELRTSRDGGLTFDAPKPIAPMAGANGTLPHTKYAVIPHHHLVADVSHGPGRGNLYFIYPSGSGPDEKQRPASVKFRRSTDGGATWSAPILLSSAPELGRDAQMPSIAADMITGEVVASWLDRRDDPENKLAKVFAARSRDGGATFLPPQPLTPPFSMGGPWIGDYNHTAAAGGTHIASFADEGGHFSTARAIWPPSARRRSVGK
ncbi:MAG TPA: sialidase family protein, partial [Thermoanaerobaculia bacterium]|nr:sialidase family protein [Thermoanaerobaculia bacterium]